MKLSTKLSRYFKATTLNDKYNLLNRKGKNETRRLVLDFGYPVNLAIQSAYFFGTDPNPHNYKNKRLFGYDD